ncbi:MAG TPA: hypothetical protein VIH00_09525 [Candidatus Limnocylindrales bacterium]
MGFLRRLRARLRGSEAPAPTGDHAPTASGPDDDDAAEREHELELLRAEQERLDELSQRQLRYADHAWRPPAQGGPQRAGDDAATQDPD